jgi:glucokinase
MAARSRGGDSTADEVRHTAFSRLGVALARWLSRFGATALVVGGAISQSWDLVYPSLVAGIHASPGDVPDLMVFAANDSEGSALLGAGWRANADTGTPF